MTLLEVLTAASGYLEKRGISSPRLNAEHLLAHSLGLKKRIDLYMQFDRPLSDADRAPVRELVRKRGEGIPLQHLLGSVEFLGREFISDARALIPRPETEQLVTFVLERLPSEACLLADVGTGSGVIAISLSLERVGARVIATDISNEALALARENAARLGCEERLEFLETDLLSGVAGQFSLVVANLPYIPTGELEGLQVEVKHDPRLALDGGEDGLVLVRRLAAEAGICLEPGGLLALEIGHDQAGAVRETLEAHNYRDIETLRDYQGVERFVMGRHG